MAEINMAPNTGSTGVRRSKKHSTRVDLTPMVDLGFLLITFFIFTTSMTEPKATRLLMPADGTGTVAPETGSLTVIMMENNKVFYYHGKLEDAMKNGAYGTTGFNFTNGIGQVIREKKTWLNSCKPDGSKALVLMIKPMEESVYRNVIDVLDEVKINDVKSYAIIDIDPVEKDLVKSLVSQ